MPFRAGRYGADTYEIAATYVYASNVENNKERVTDAVCSCGSLGRVLFRYCFGKRGYRAVLRLWSLFVVSTSHTRKEVATNDFPNTVNVFITFKFITNGHCL